MKKGYFILAIAVLILIGGASWWSKSKVSNDESLISSNGIHWHPELTIVVKGEKQVIPANLGIGAQYAYHSTFDRSMGMTAIHTHDDANQGIIHFEFGGKVRKSDLALGKFLEIWGKDMGSFGTLTKMVVNGEESAEFENYIMRDGDKIELFYE